MEFKGTKGKWIYDNSLQMNSGYRVVYSDNGVLIHKSENKNGLSETEIEANAQLISCAPEMLEMLEDVKAYLGSDVREKVEHIIKKATEI
jgi:hypothetical protein